MTYIPRPTFHESWSTEKEVEFLKELGSHGDRRRNRVELLRNYAEAMKLRTYWGGINRKVVEIEIQYMLARGNFDG